MRTPMPRPLLLVFSLLAALSSPPTLPGQDLSSGHTSSPDTTQRFEPETGFPGVEETKLDTTQGFDSETGRPLIEPSIQPQELPTDREPGAGEPAMHWPVLDDKFKPVQFLARGTFPIQFTVGRANDGIFIAGNVALSYRFSESNEIEVSRDFYESFYLYPVLTLGTLFTRGNNFTDDGLIVDYEVYQVLYGIIEGHRQWEIKNLRPSVFVGVGLGRYWSSRSFRGISADEHSEDAGTGPMLSAGAQLEIGRLIGGLRVYRIPGFRKFITFPIVGYQPKSYKGIWIIAKYAAIPAAVGALGIVLYYAIVGCLCS